MTPLVDVRGVSKRFRGDVVLDALELSWSGPGTLVVLGANGAGKSTLLRILAGVVTPDRGEVAIGGRSIRRDRAAALRLVGWAPDAAELPPHLAVDELLSLVASLKRAPRPTAALLGVFDVAELLRVRFSALSLGQRQRVCLTAALVGDPPLVLFDEPSTALDAGAVASLRGLLRDRRSRGLAAIVATHDGALADAVADRTVELAFGRASSRG